MSRTSKKGSKTNHMNVMNMQMRSMNRFMNSMMPDPFNMMSPFDNRMQGMQGNALVERGNDPMGGLFGFPAMPTMNRLMTPDFGGNGASFCSSSVISMSSGPDGRPQVYQASSSSKTGPGGVRETRKTVQDSRTGLKKMAIGHHIGERSHIIEKEQDFNSGQLEERQEFVNLDEEEAEDFDREFTTKVRGHSAIGGIPNRRPQAITIESLDDDDEEQSLQGHHSGRRSLLALPAPPIQMQQQQQQQQQQQPSVHPHPYNVSAARRNHRSKHSKVHQKPQVDADEVIVVPSTSSGLTTNKAASVHSSQSRKSKKH